MSVLKIQLPGLPPVMHVLKDDTITIGRMKGNTIVIDDDSVSLCHAKITRLNGHFYLKDLNSTNGTLVNGQTISESPLRHHDRVRFADVIGEFRVEGAADPVPVPPTVVQTPAAPPPIQALPAPALQIARRPSAATAADAAPVAPGPAAVKKRRVVPLMPIAGGATALVVVAFFGWKLLHNSGINPDDAAALPSQPGLAQSASVPGVKQPRASTPLPPTSAAEQQTVTITGWIKALKAGDVVARRNAARALNSFGPEANTALPGLHAALKDTDAEVRTWSALALIDHKSYDKAIVPILVQALQQDDALLRQVSCLSLAVIPHEEADKESIVPALATTAGQDADADVRKAAVSALNIIAPELVSREASK